MRADVCYHEVSRFYALMKEGLFMKKLLRVLSLILVTALLFGVMPAAFAENGEIGSIDELMGFFNRRVQRPKESSLLAEPEKMFVLTDYGYSLPVLPRPGTGNCIMQVPDRSPVTVYARESGYALATVDDGTGGGWMKESCLVPDTGDELQPPKMSDVMIYFTSEVQRPLQRSLVYEPQLMKIRSSYGRGIYAWSDPYKDAKKLQVVPEAAYVVVFAYQDGFALAAATEYSVSGWMKVEFLVPVDEEEIRSSAEKEQRIEELMPSFPDKTQKPTSSALFDEPKEMTVRSTCGKWVYVMDGPGTVVTGLVPDGLKVTAYAKQDIFVLARSEDGSYGGWFGQGLLVPSGG